MADVWTLSVECPYVEKSKMRREKYHIALMFISAYDPDMNLRRPVAVQNKQVTEKIIDLATISVAADIEAKWKDLDTARVKIDYERKIPGVYTEKFVVGLGVAVVKELTARGVDDIVFNLEASREAGQIEVPALGYNFGKNRVWDRPVLVFMRQEAVAAEVQFLPIRQEPAPIAA